MMKLIFKLIEIIIEYLTKSKFYLKILNKFHILYLLSRSHIYFYYFKIQRIIKNKIYYYSSLNRLQLLNLLFDNFMYFIYSISKNLLYIFFFILKDSIYLINYIIKFFSNKIWLRDILIYFLFFIIFFNFFFFSINNFIYKFLFIIILPIIHLLLIKRTNYKYLKLWSLAWSYFIFIYFLTFIYILMIVSRYSNSKLYIFSMYFNFNNMKILYGIDIISLLFIGLTAFLFIIVFLSLQTLEMVDLKKYFIIIYILYFFLINIFLTQNLFIFFFFFESVVFPMFFIILMGGSRFQKTKAAYYFFFFTVFGSLCMFISINYLLYNFGTLNINTLIYYMNDLSIIERRWIWLSFFLSFAIKVPMFPFHTWLPEAHVEAPTVGSVLLAGILLKLGVYGFIRICFFILPEANVFFSPIVYILCIISILYSCLIAIRQTDIKRIIAYASIAHMNLIILGLFSFTSIGIYGAIFQSISHGLVASALFLLVGMLYSRYKSRLINYYSGLTQVMPLFSFFFLSFTLANISFPLTSNFIGELLLFIGISKLYFGILILSLFSIILNTIYSLWFCNRVLYGNIKSHLLINFKDLTILEIYILSLLFLSVLLLGIFPNIIGYIPINFSYSLLFLIKTLSFIQNLYI